MVLQWMFVIAYVAVGLKVAAIIYRGMHENHHRRYKVERGDQVFFGFSSLGLGLLFWPFIAVSYGFAQIAKKGLMNGTNGRDHERIRRL